MLERFKRQVKETTDAAVRKTKNVAEEIRKQGFTVDSAINAAVFGGVVLAAQAPSYDEKLKLHDEQVHSDVRREVLKQTAPEYREEIEKWKNTRRADMPEVWQNAWTPDSNIGGIARAAYLEQHFLENAAGTLLSPVMIKELKELVAGQIATESRFDNKKVSPSGAIGAVQAMPETLNDWFKVAGKKYKTEHDLENLRKSFANDFAQQVEFMNWYFPFMYEELVKVPGMKDVLKKLRHRYFTEGKEGDEQFDKYMVTMVLKNGYNAGFKRMADLLEELDKSQPHKILDQGYFAFYVAINDTKNKRFLEENRHYNGQAIAFSELFTEAKINGIDWVLNEAQLTKGKKK